MKILNNKKIIFTLIFLACFVRVDLASAQSILSVEFENEPLFSETNFVPNQAVTKYVRVTNNSTEGNVVLVEAINLVSCNPGVCLSDALNLIIKKGPEEFFNDSLTEFFDSGEIILGNLSNGETNQYDFIVTFKPESGNEYQSLSTGFDLLVGLQGTGEYIISGETVVGGGGGNGPPGLVIKDEASVVVNFNSVEISWRTSFPATSQVIYRKEGETYFLNLSDPKYGYPRVAPDAEDTNKVLDHLVTIIGLIPGDVYYYRVVSHASPATISFEHSFKMPTTEDLLGAGTFAVVSNEEGKETLIFRRDQKNDGDIIIGNSGGFGPEFDSLDSMPTLVAKASTSTELGTKGDSSRLQNIASVAFALPWLGEISLWWTLLLLIIFFLIWYFSRRK